MKVKKLLELQALIEESKIPVDMTDRVSHWSESRGQWLNILDMDLIHLVRAYSKSLDGNTINDKEIMREKLDTILKEVYKAREVLDD